MYTYVHRGSSFRSSPSKESLSSADYNAIAPSTLLALQEEGEEGETNLYDLTR
jgi:hypothetical protein